MKLILGKRWVLEAMLAFAPTLYGHWEMRKDHRPRTKKLPSSASKSARLKVLLVDHDFPEIDHDAGSRAIGSFAKLLLEAGWEVVFWAASMAPSAAGRQWLRTAGIQPLGRSETGPLTAWLASEPGFSSVILSRPLVAAMYLPIVRRWIHGVCLYYGHDIHYRRLRAMRLATGRGVRRWESWVTKVLEHRLWRESDVVLYPSTDEAEAVNAYRRQRGLQSNAQMFPLWTMRFADKLPSVGVARRRGLLFVGSRGHAPNVDGLDWFFREVMPLLREAKGSCDVTVVGSGMETYRPPSGANVCILGRIDDAALEACYNAARVVIAPLRYGGGVKGKVVEAISKRVPCVMTPVAAQGLTGIERILPVKGEAAQFALAIDSLLQDDRAWNEASSGAFHFLLEQYDHRRCISKIGELLVS